MSDSRACLLPAGGSCDDCSSLGSLQMAYVQAGPLAGHRSSIGRSIPLDIHVEGHATNRGHGMVRAMTLPARHSTLTRDPFPELSNSPMTPTLSHIPMDTSARSTPSSSPPRNHGNQADQLGGFRSSPVSRSGSGYDLNVGTRSISGYDLLAGSRTLTVSHDNDTFSRDSDQEQDLIERDYSSWTPSSYNKTLLFFYTDDQNYRSLVVDNTTQACDVCHSLVEKNRAKDDINWVLVEHDLRLKLERFLEDHECVNAAQRLWSDPEDFRLYFRKDFRKFEPFRNPANFITPDMVDQSQLQDSDVSDLLPSEERYNHILLQHLFVIDQLPDIFGQCHLKDSKKSWKKTCLVLKSSGLYYSSKGSSKDSKHLVQLCDLEKVEVYSATDAKRSFVAPHPFCLCLKQPQVTDTKEMIFLCTEDEKSLLCWFTALRLQKEIQFYLDPVFETHEMLACLKFKTQLKDDYKAAVNHIERATLKQNGVLLTEDGHIRERVAMDFTGTRGRVVEDPSEAFGVACEEAHQWRKKVTGRKVAPGQCDPDIGRPAFLTNNNVIQQQYTQGLGAGVHMVQPWFHSGISRQQAVDLITRHGLVDGVFLLRESQSISGIHVLSLAHNHKVKHCQIHKVDCDGQQYYSLDGGSTKFTDLIQLVEFYQLNAAGLPTKLAHYVMCLA